MNFAKIAFIGAGVWGIVVLTPLYFLLDISGRQYVPPADYPHFFYGFVSVAMAWQFAFLLIGSDPARYRMLMPIAMFEKFSFILTLAVLHSRGRIAMMDAMAGVPDFVLGVLFVVAFVKTGQPARLTSRAA
jgi:hypothetical protein